MEAAELNPGAARAFVKRIQADPVAHIEDVQGVATLEDYQRRICQAIAEHDRVAVAACHDMGKSFTMARIALWFGSAFPGSRVITTAPTFNQIKNVLWSEIRNGHARSKYPLGGEILQTQWKIADDWFAIGFSPQKAAGSDEGQGTASSFQGFHAAHVLVLFDEATGIPKSIWDQAEGMLTSGHVKFVAIGNPTSRNSEFYRCFQSPMWKKVYLSCFDSPNLIASGVTDMESLLAEIDRVRELPEDARLAHVKAYKIVQPKLLSLRWVVEMAIKWGVDHPLFVSKVLGRFPEQDDKTLITLGSIEEAQRRVHELNPLDRVSIGVDVARFGSDRTVITTLRGLEGLGYQTLIKRDTTAVSGAVIQEAKRWLEHPRITIVVDGTGVGSGVVDQLKEAQGQGILPDHVEIREVNFGETFKYIPNEAERKEKEDTYVNRKALLFVRLAKDLREKLSLPDDQAYLEELPTILYRFDSKGRYMIESKDEYKKRTGRPSPDIADSLALANEGRYFEGTVSDFTEAHQAYAPTLAPGLHAEVC